MSHTIEMRQADTLAVSGVLLANRYRNGPD